MIVSINVAVKSTNTNTLNTNTNSSEAIERQRSIWVFFSSLLNVALEWTTTGQDSMSRLN